MMQEPSPSRRKFLKQTTSGVVLLAVAGILPRDLLLVDPDEQIPSGLKYFSAHEYLVFQAIADRIVGPSVPNGASAGDVDDAQRADEFLATADPEVQDQFHQLLSVFNAPLFTFLFDFRFSSFLNMSPEDKDSYLEDWMTSYLGFRRTGFQALKRISLSMFYTDGRSWPEIGYEGMFLPEDRK
jgi:hypothetical protein